MSGKIVYTKNNFVFAQTLQYVEHLFTDPKNCEIYDPDWDF